MRYEKLKELRCEQFRRLTGVKKATFEKMVIILREAKDRMRSKGGRRSKLSIEDMLLLTLEYLREYRTYFHIGNSYGISESTAFNTIRFVEDTLIKHKDFALPGRKVLLKSDVEYEVILIDATESPVQRPKKSSGASTQARRKDTR